MIRFGPAGNSPLFYENGGKDSSQVPAWLHSLGLNAYEYQCTRGVKVGRAKAEAIGAAAAKYDIAVSIHAPYYINLATEDALKKINTTKHLLKSLEVAGWMGARLVVFHPGAVGKQSRQAAMERACTNLIEILTVAADQGLGNILLAPETCGKQNQLGTLDEIIEFCRLAPGIVPTIDFAHLHAISGGALTTGSAFAQILTRLEDSLGQAIVQKLHIHFSPVTFTAKGEKAHSSLLEADPAPSFAYLAALILERDLQPTIICESSERQVLDALAYRNLWLEQNNHPA
jgi:deoxyribonuclease-4